jgi:serine/threonine protein kinase
MHKLAGKFVAVKSINKQYLSLQQQQQIGCGVNTKKVMQEVLILKRIRHRNVVRLYEYFETPKHILFIMELCAGGDLLNYVRKRRRLREE